MEVYYKGVIFPSGSGGLQPRHKTFLFILARNPGKALSYEDIQAKIRELKLDEFTDNPQNSRSRVKKALRKMSEENPEKITKNDVDTLIKTVPKDLTRITLNYDEIYTIYGDEEYEQL